MLEGRRAEFVDEVRKAENLRSRSAEKVVDAAIDRWVWYAGWSDKLAQVHGSSNPVAGPYFDFSVPEPTGVVAVIAPQQSTLLGLVSVVAPVIVSGNTCVVVAGGTRPDPGDHAHRGARDVRPSRRRRQHAHRRCRRARARGSPSHMDVNTIDLCGASPDTVTDLERAAAENLKRVVRRRRAASRIGSDDPSLERMLAFLETKTVWHPIGV